MLFTITTMKDVTISGNTLIRELKTLLVCFVVAFLLNALAIVIYKTHLFELISSLQYVLLVSVVLYFVWSMIRLLIAFLKWLIGPKRKKRHRHLRSNDKPLKF